MKLKILQTVAKATVATGTFFVCFQNGPAYTHVLIYVIGFRVVCCAVAAHQCTHVPNCSEAQKRGFAFDVAHLKYTQRTERRQKKNKQKTNSTQYTVCVLFFAFVSPRLLQLFGQTNSTKVTVSFTVSARGILCCWWCTKCVHCAPEDNARCSRSLSRTFCIFCLLCVHTLYFGGLLGFLKSCLLN